MTCPWTTSIAQRVDTKVFEDAGLYDPSDESAAERLELLEWLVDLGVSLEQMVESNARGELLRAASVGVIRPGPFLTQRQLADRLGVSMEVVDSFRVAFALPPLAEDAPWCNEKEAEMFGSVAEGVGLFGDEEMRRLMRVIGSSVSRIAEAMATTNQQRIRGILGKKSSELELGKAILAASQSAGAPARIVTGLLSIHLQSATHRVTTRRSDPGQLTTNGCVGFVDLVGSTALARRLSVPELTAVVDRFEEVAHEIAVNRRGRVVKFIGDEVMFVTRDAASASEIALALVEAFAGDRAVKPRGGLAEGALLDRSGDYHGPVVNLAARLAELAVASEVLAPADIADGIASRGLRCESAGRRLLRGFEEPMALVSVHRGS